MLRNNFAILLAGQSVANIGDILYIVSIINFVFVLTESAAIAAVVPFTITSAMFLASILTPLLIGRFRLNRLLAGTQISKTIFIVGLGLILPILNSANYYFIFIVIAVIALCDGCANPISQTLIPYYVESERLVKANGIFEGVYQTINTIMWLAGGTLLLILSSNQMIWTVAFLFFVSSIMLCFLSKVTYEEEEDEERPQNMKQLKEGWITLLKTPILRKVAYLEVLETLAGVVWIAAILYVYVSEVLNAGQQWWGFINGVFFIGLILGGLIFIRFDQYVERHLSRVILIGLAAGGIATALFAINTVPLVALFLSLIVGLSGQLVGIPKQTIIQTSVPEVKLGNVYSSLGALGTGVFGIASLLIGIMADLLGVRSVFLLSSLLLIIAAIVVYSGRRLFIRTDLKSFTS